MKKITFLLFITFNFALSKSTFSQEMSLSASVAYQLSWSNSDNAPSIIEPGNALPILKWAIATCFCKVSYDNLTNQQSGTGVCLDLTGIVNKTYSGLTPMSEENRNDCNVRCTNVTAALSAGQKQAIADCACAAGKSNGTAIRSYSAVGTKDYKSSHQLGTLANTLEVIKTTCKCPTGWVSNTTNQDGGETTDGKCKKGVCGPIAITPLPPNSTPIGTWGFTWGNTVFAWGSPINGGAAVCNTTIITPRICKIQ